MIVTFSLEGSSEGLSDHDVCLAGTFISKGVSMTHPGGNLLSARASARNHHSKTLRPQFPRGSTTDGFFNSDSGLFTPLSPKLSKSLIHSALSTPSTHSNLEFNTNPAHSNFLGNTAPMSPTYTAVLFVYDIASNLCQPTKFSDELHAGP
uniref:Uncharacterized protein n=1 Tax=Opuntia streptacantha TaxID=393608 RepID=A0A7C9EWN9_OPUST